MNHAWRALIKGSLPQAPEIPPGTLRALYAPHLTEHLIALDPGLLRETEELAKLQLAGVNQIAAKYAAPAGTSLLLVGDLSQIEAGIRELNLGEIVILDAEGKPVRR